MISKRLMSFQLDLNLVLLDQINTTPIVWFHPQLTPIGKVIVNVL